MAKFAVCSVVDRAAGCFGTPFFVPAKGVGIRSFTDEVNREDKANQLYLHPEDFDLYCLGDFDDNQGGFVCEQVMLVRGKDVVKSVAANGQQILI